MGTIELGFSKIKNGKWNGSSKADNVIVNKSAMPSTRIYLGVGNDTIFTKPGVIGTHIYGERGFDVISLSGSYTYASGGDDRDKIYITSDAGEENEVYGDAGDDWIYYYGKNKTFMHGGAGKDIVRVHGSNGEIYGDEGDDHILIYGDGIDNLVYGGAGNDYILLEGAKDNKVNLGAGRDTVELQSAGSNADNARDGSNELEDYSYSSDVIRLSHSSSTGQEKAIDFSSKESLHKAFLADGIISADLGFAYGSANPWQYGTAKQSVKLKDVNGHYCVHIQQCGGTINAGFSQLDEHWVYWAGEKGGKIDASSQTKTLVMLGSTNDEADNILGGKKNDTIFAGSNDSIYGGGGDDSILLDGAENACVELHSAGGKDTVTGFDGGFEDGRDVLYLSEGLDNQVKLEISANGADLDISRSSGKLHLEGLRGADLGGNSAMKGVLVTTGGEAQKVAAVREEATGIVRDGEIADYYVGKKSKLDASAVTDTVEIDLGNENRCASTAHYEGIVAVKGSNSADNILIGSAAVNNTIEGGAGGSNSLYGGGASHDLLVGSNGAEDRFYFGAGNGNDTIKSYGEEDVVELLSGTLTDANMDEEGRLKLIFQEVQEAQAQEEQETQEAQVGQKAEIRLAFDQDMRDAVVTYEMGGVTHGAKFGASLTITDDTSDFVTVYQNTENNAGQLLLSGKDDKAVWLNGSQGKLYSGFTTIDASKMKGDAILVGATADENIIGGQGDNSLWGGAGNDTLQGGRGYNEFYFTKGDGKDIIKASNNEDKVMLYNVLMEEVDFDTTGLRKNGNLVLALQDGSSLTLANFATKGAGTIQLQDAVFHYDRQSSSWAQQALAQPQPQQ